MYVGTLHKDLGKIADTTTEKSVLPVEYYLPVDVGDHIEVTMEIILQVSDKVKSEKWSIYISIKDYTHYCRKEN